VCFLQLNVSVGGLDAYKTTQRRVAVLRKPAARPHFKLKWTLNPDPYKPKRGRRPKIQEMSHPPLETQDLATRKLKGCATRRFTSSFSQYRLSWADAVSM